MHEQTSATPGHFTTYLLQGIAPVALRCWCWPPPQTCAGLPAAAVAVLVPDPHPQIHCRCRCQMCLNQRCWTPAYAGAVVTFTHQRNMLKAGSLKRGMHCQNTG